MSTFLFNDLKKKMIPFFLSFYYNIYFQINLLIMHLLILFFHFELWKKYTEKFIYFYVFGLELKRALYSFRLPDGELFTVWIDEIHFRRQVGVIFFSIVAVNHSHRKITNEIRQKISQRSYSKIEFKRNWMPQAICYSASIIGKALLEWLLSSNPPQ